MNPTLHITTTRMLKLLEHMIEIKIAKTQGEALKQIGFNQANIWKIKGGRNMFTVDQIDAACTITGASADYIFDYTNNMMRKPAKKPIDQIKEAVQALEAQMSK